MMANRFDEIVDFSFATKTDVDEIMKFFYEYWGKTHILATDKAFFEYEFGGMGDQINFLLARDKNNRELLGIYGFYTYNMGICGGPLDIAGGPSKVSLNCMYPFLGLEMYKRLPQMLNARVLIGVGLNKNTSLQISSRLLKKYNGKMKQFYRLNANCSYNIAQISRKEIITIDEPLQYELEEVSSINNLIEMLDVDSFVERIPFKDKNYIDKRYFNHPIYKYRVYVLEEQMAIVTREIEVNNVKILRIVDVLGNVSYLNYIGKFLDKLMYINGYEYIDFIETGLDDNILTKMGFIENDKVNVIPNYFEPFVQSNVDIYFDTTDSSAVIFKADADQDRPNWR